MPVITPPSVTPLPTVPEPGSATFRSDSFAFTTALPGFGEDMQALADNVENNAQVAADAATTAGGHATTASGAAITASGAATTAGGHATTASGAATTAGGHATTAAGHATTATTKAAEATTASAQAQASAASALAIVLGVSTGMPSIRPSFLADYANSRAIDPRSSFTRASTAYRVSQFGLLEQVASGGGRIDFDPVALACLGLLIEESRTNLLTYSDQFDTAAWAKNNTTVSPNAAVAPDGTLTADKLVEDTATAVHNTVQTISVTSGQPYTVTVYAKTDGTNRRLGIFLGASGFGTGTTDEFDLNTGTVSGNASGGALIESAGNGWYRCRVTRTATVTASGVNLQFRIFKPDAPDTLTYTGDGTSGPFIWRAKLEAGAFPTSPDQTVASTVTRAADSVTVTGTSFSSWYRQDEGSVIVTARSAPGVGSVDQHVFSLTDSGGTNRITLYRNTSRFAVLVIDVGGVTQATLTSVATWADNTVAKIGMSFKAGSFVLTLNGAAAVTAASGSVPTVDRLVLGNTVAGTRAFNGWIERFGFFPKQISNSELIAGATQ